MLRPLLLALTFAFFSQSASASASASAATLHVDMTPELAGDKGVTMKPLDKDTTRFTIRISTTNDPKSVDLQFPFVRRGGLDVRGEHGRILRCTLQPKEQGGDLLFTFDLENEHAKTSWFELVEQFDDGQVGGGKIFTYRLIDFIDPDYRATELLQDIRPQVLSEIEISSALLPPGPEKPKSP
jgi:hypothetical protein